MNIAWWHRFSAPTTAVIDAASNPSGYNEQEVYLDALTTAHSVDYIAYGSYVARVKYAPLAVKAASRSRNPEIVHPQWPIMVQDSHVDLIPDVTFTGSYADREEKGLRRERCLPPTRRRTHQHSRRRDRHLERQRPAVPPRLCSRPGSPRPRQSLPQLPGGSIARPAVRWRGQPLVAPPVGHRPTRLPALRPGGYPHTPGWLVNRFDHTQVRQ